MLALTRKRGESIIIGGEIEVILITTGRESAKIGVKAPRHIRVDRKELHDQIMAENKEGAGMDRAALKGLRRKLLEEAMAADQKAIEEKKAARAEYIASLSSKPQDD